MAATQFILVLSLLYNGIGSVNTSVESMMAIDGTTYVLDISVGDKNASTALFGDPKEAEPIVVNPQKLTDAGKLQPALFEDLAACTQTGAHMKHLLETSESLNYALEFSGNGFGGSFPAFTVTPHCSKHVRR